jgi:RHS repeat-associated protein
MAYDGRDNLVGVTDPLGNTTRYTWDGLDNQVRLDSPDTGISDYEYDAAGNRTAAIDARGIRVEYSYDPLNRLTDVSYPDSTLDVSYSYDAGTNGKGRLTGMSDAVGTVDYSYDARGNLSSEIRSIGAVQYITSYAYNSADRLTRITYPSGMVIDYTLDAAGRIVTLDKTVEAVTEALASNIQYEPFGPVSTFTYGNGLVYSATFDQDYELDRLQSGSGLDWLYSYDATGNILSIADQVDGLNDQLFGYDSLDRLESAVGHYGNEAFEYDANGNRKRFVNDSTDDSYTYEAQSNRLLTQGNWTLSRDAAGNRSSKLDAGGHGQLYEYGDHNRLSQASFRDGSGDTIVGTYEYDGRGQRTIKTADSRTTHFIFGSSGALLGEYDSETMQVSKEYIYLNGQLIAIHDKRQDTVQPPGAVYIVDNEDSGATRTGSWSLKSSGQAHGGNHREARKKAANTFRWAFTHGYPGSTFKVSARWVTHKSSSSQVDYQVMHDTGTAELDVITVNQKSGGGEWHELGTFSFWGGVPEWVEINAANGKTSADAIRFEEIPDPVIVNTQATYFVHTDHLGTPRRVSDDLQTLVWSWDSTPFGESPPNQDPDGNFQEFVLDLRYPGQYFEGETGLYYNYFRTYDPSIGRYVESDPIGLDGGANTYGYGLQNPLANTDAHGLVVWKVLDAFTLSGAIGIGGTFSRYVLESPCFEGFKHQIEVWAVGPTAGGQISCRVCFTAPVSVPAGSGFEDGSVVGPNPAAFNGGFLDLGAAAQLLGLGGTAGDVVLGSAISVGSITPTLGFGSIGLGVSGTVGTSRVVKHDKIECSSCE